MSSFSQLGLPDALVSTLTKQGITEPFPIQESTIPACLAGSDVCGKAPTGSGKTLAFGLPLLATVQKGSPKAPKALILAPTRELAEQIRAELSPLASSVGRSVAAIYGGTSYTPQRKVLNRGLDVLVATPGRLEDLIEQGAVKLSAVSIVVVDEADRMADMGFLPAVKRILDATSDDRQTLLFSATLDGDVAHLVERYQTNPAKYETAGIAAEADVQHHFWLVEANDRVDHTAAVTNRLGRSIVFTRTRHGADRVARQLTRAGVEAVAMHGGRSQSQRNRALGAFGKGRVQALVATDVAARGIHIDSVDAVVHFDVAADEKDFVHRSGRTGRAGATGTVVTLVTPDKRRTVERIQRNLSLKERTVRGDVTHLEDRGARAKSQAIGSDPTDRANGSNGNNRTNGTNGSNRATGSKRQNDTGDQTTTIFVGNLPWSTTSDDLDRLFSRHGHVVTADVARRRGGQSKGYGLVEMPARSAPRAIEAVHSKKLDGRTLVVRTSR